jgi:uncharacterized protein with HEPN domain
MPRDLDEYLADILRSIGAIRSYTKQGRASFLRHAMAQDAVVARIIQIGEAVKALQTGGIDLGRQAPEIAWKDVVGMRDLLSHQYWRIDPQALWAVAVNDLAPLSRAVAKLRRKPPRRFRRT